jgi:glutamate N-acetyltransferase/amino-acid N-acetyltransferase
MEIYDSESEYIETLEKRSILPPGFLCSTTSVEFIPKEKPALSPYKMNLSLIVADRETEYYSALFTRNRFPGAPVIIGKQRLGRKTIKGILINNKISNVCTPGGAETAQKLLDEMGRILGAEGDAFFPASTGIIGWKLPFDEMKKALPILSENLQPRTILPVARAIMTTDSYPKVRSGKVENGTITAIAKGAGMIEPNLATMLVFILTDLYLEKSELGEALRIAAGKSFNRISVDSDQSTSDTVILLSSGKKKISDRQKFIECLTGVCASLAEDIVRNGEGTAHVIRVRVRGDEPEETLSGIGKAVVNSPLVKTAIFGNDPNVGRIVCSIGDFLGNFNIDVDTDVLGISMGGIEIFSKNAFLIDSQKEKQLSDYLSSTKLENTKEKKYPSHDKCVEITVGLGKEKNEVIITGSDLTYGYVKENADYRS